MKTDDSVLDEIIKEGKVDIEIWPSLVNNLLIRLDNIVQSAFPATQLSAIGGAATGGANSEEAAAAAEQSEKSVVDENEQKSAKEGEEEEQQSSSGSADNNMSSEDREIVLLVREILSTTFSASPPYTVQRLAELLRNPNQYYRSLNKYLRAMQRVLSVSSTVCQFPLPPPLPSPGHPEGAHVGIGGFARIPLGSDEALGGALLTPITWLKPGMESDEAVLPNGGLPGGGEGEGGSSSSSPQMDQEMTNSFAGGAREEVGQHVIQAQGPPTLGPEDVGPQPEGLVLPDVNDAPSPSRQLVEQHVVVVVEEDNKMVAEGESTEVAMVNVDEDTVTANSEPEPSTQNEDGMDVDVKSDNEEGGNTI